MKNISLPFLGFLQSTGIVIYVCIIAFFIENGETIFGNLPFPFAPMVFLLVFITSAVITSTLFLGRAGYLFWEKKYKSSFTLVVWTTVWTIFYIFLILASLSYIK